ncbi:protein phosphatase 1 regulatory subunit 14C [Festucalex cinctus]
MSAASTETSAPPPLNAAAAAAAAAAAGRVFFQAGSAPLGVVVGASDDPAQKRPGKVTVKYDRKELRKRLVLEEWIVEQLSRLYDCEEEEMPEVEIDIDDLLEVNSDDERAVKLQESLTDCYKPTEDFVRELLGRIRGMRKLSAPSKKAL